MQLPLWGKPEPVLVLGGLHPRPHPALPRDASSREPSGRGASAGAPARPPASPPAGDSRTLSVSTNCSSCRRPRSHPPSAAALPAEGFQEGSAPALPPSTHAHSTTPRQGPTACPGPPTGVQLIRPLSLQPEPPCLPREGARGPREAACLAQGLMADQADVGNVHASFSVEGFPSLPSLLHSSACRFWVFWLQAGD